MENNHLILYATCPSCGAEEEVGRVINPEPEDYDQSNADLKQLCRVCASTQGRANRAKVIPEVLELLASKGFSLADAEELLFEARSRVADIIQAAAIQRAKKPLSEFISGNGHSL